MDPEKALRRIAVGCWIFVALAGAFMAGASCQQRAFERAQAEHGWTEHAKSKAGAEP